MTKTHSRPYTSSDNPYSEAGFKTLKFRPEFPVRFDDIEHARAHCRQFFDWYNHAHRHSGIGLMTPAAVHHGHAPALHAARGLVLDAAYQRHPERFVRVYSLIDGFESPLGLELLTTVHWAADQEGASTPEEALEIVSAWTERKARTFREQHVAVAWARRASEGWLPTIAV